MSLNYETQALANCVRFCPLKGFLQSFSTSGTALFLCFGSLNEATQKTVLALRSSLVPMNPSAQ